MASADLPTHGQLPRARARHVGRVALGAELYYTGTSETIVHSKGVVVGPATTEGFVGKGVALRFPDSEESVDCLLTEVRPPA